MPSPNTIYGFLGSFPKGVNSDIDPLLLPEGQLSYAINATMRGDFVRCRPNFFNIALNDTTSGAFQSGLFQGTCYYRTSGDGTIMMAVNGQLFQITIDQDTATVTQINLPDAGGSTTTTVQWLWQAEQWCIWNDGICQTCRVQSASVDFTPGTNRWSVWAVSKWGVESDAVMLTTNYQAKTKILK